MAKTTEKAEKTSKKAENKAISREWGLATLEVPYVQLSAQEMLDLGHPSRVRVSLTGCQGNRRRKLHAIFRGLKARGDTILKWSGDEYIEMPVHELGHVFLWWLDNIEIPGID